MKKRNKKYNRVEAVRRNNERILKGFAVAYFANDETPKQDIILTNIKGDVMPVNKTMAEAISEFPYKWSIMLGVFCVEKGLKTCKMELVKFTERYYQSDLVAYLNDRHQAFIQKQKDKNVNMSGAGWIASPVGRDFSEDEAGNIFSKLGAI